MGLSYQREVFPTIRRRWRVKWKLPYIRHKSVACERLAFYFAEMLLGDAEIWGYDLGGDDAEDLFPSGVKLGFHHLLVGAVVKIGGKRIFSFLYFAG